MLFPADEQTTVDVERAAKAHGRVGRGRERLPQGDRRGDDAGDAALAITLRLKLGRVLVEEMQQVDEALTVYRAVYDADSENAEALAALERLYRATSRYADLLGIYEKRRELSTDHGEKKQISYEIAKLYETELKDLDKAIDTYNGVLEDEPTDARALEALDVLYGQLERWEPYVDTLRRRIELDVTEAELIDLKYRLGQTLEKHTGDAAGALENYREILFLDAQHAGAREALEALLENEDLRAEAASILENIYEERGDWAKLLVALDILARGGGRQRQARVAPPQDRARLERDAQRPRARVQGARRGAQRAARTTPRRAPRSSASPSISTTWKALTELYERDRREPHRRAARARLLDALGADRRPAARSRRRSGQGLHARPLARPGRRRGARRARGALLAHAAMDRSHRRHRASHRADGRPGAARAALRRRWRASTTSSSVVPTTPSLRTSASSSSTRVDQTALAALDALFTRQRMWSDLAENLESQLALATDDDAQIALMLRLASLRETEMSQVEQAIEGYRSVLERDVSNAQALGALERLGREPAHELVIADLLEPLYRQIGDYQKLIGAHEVQVRRSRRRRAVASSSSTRSRSSTRTPRPISNNAFATLARALKEDPANDVDAARRSTASRARPAASRTSRQVYQAARRRAGNDAAARAARSP